MAKKAASKPAPKGKASAKPAAPGLKKAPNAAWEEQKKKAEKAWRESRGKAPVRGNYVPDLEDGDYIFRIIGAKVDSYKKGDKKGSFYFAMTVAVAFHEEKTGVKINVKNDLDPTPFSDESETSPLDILSGQLQSIDIDISEMEFGEFPDLAEQLSNDKPYFRGGYELKINEGKGKNAGKTYKNPRVYFNEPLSQEDLDELTNQFGDAGIPAGADKGEATE